MPSDISSAEYAHKLSIQADKLDETGHYREAFKLWLVAAKLGDTGAQLNLGNYYADGKGTKKDLSEAERWYRKAYKAGEPGGANNLACDKRDSGNYRAAILWFKKALALDEGGAAVELAKIYLKRNQQKLAIAALKQALAMDPSLLTEYERETADAMIQKLTS